LPRYESATSSDDSIISGRRGAAHLRWTVRWPLIPLIACFAYNRTYAAHGALQARNRPGYKALPPHVPSMYRARVGVSISATYIPACLPGGLCDAVNAVGALPTHRYGHLISRRALREECFVLDLNRLFSRTRFEL